MTNRTIKTNRTDKTIRIKTSKTDKTTRIFVRDRLNRLKVLRSQGPNRPNRPSPNFPSLPLCTFRKFYYLCTIMRLHAGGRTHEHER